MTAFCRSCQRPIVWAKTTSGRPMPVDIEPTDDGNIVLANVDGTLTALVVSERDKRPHYRAHFATCPDAADWRRRQQPKGATL